MMNEDSLQGFDEAVTAFISHLKAVTDEYYARQYKTLTPPVYEVMRGKRYARIVRVDTLGDGRSAHAFIDMTNGDILKPDGWKKPAKHARGNIYDTTSYAGSTMGSGFITYLK